MNISITKIANETRFEIEGRLDTATAPVLEKAVNDEGDSLTNLVFDMSKLEYISSAGLRVLLSSQKKMNKVGTMKLVNVCENVMDIFEMTGFADVLVIE